MTPTPIPTTCPLCGGTNWQVQGVYRYCGTCVYEGQVMHRIDTILISALPGQTAQEAWADSEGLYLCEAHLDYAEPLAQPYVYIAVPADLEAQVEAEGQCEVCWENWAEGMRRISLADIESRFDAEIDYLRRHRK